MLRTVAAVAPSEERKEIEALYRKHDPAKLVEVDDLVAKYGDFKLLGNAARSSLPSGLHSSKGASYMAVRTGMVRKKYRDMAKLETYVGQLDKVELLMTLSHDDKMDLARTLTAEEYGAEEAIVTEGESADCMYFLQSGTASAVKRGSPTDPSAIIVLKEYSAGDFFGELALSAADAKRGATVMSTSFETSVLKLPSAGFAEMLASNSEVAQRLREEKERYAEASARLLGSGAPHRRDCSRLCIPSDLPHP